MPNCNLTKLQWNWLRVDCQNLSTGWRYARRNSLSTNFSSFLTGNLTVPGAESGPWMRHPPILVPNQAHQTEGRIPRTLLGTLTSLNVAIALRLTSQERNFCASRKHIHTVFASSFKKMATSSHLDQSFRTTKLQRAWERGTKTSSHNENPYAQQIACV